MEKKIGKVTHYYSRIGVAVLNLSEGLQVGDEIHFQGHTTDFTQRVEHMEVNHHPLQSVGPGADVAVKVIARVREGDTVYRVIEEPTPPVM